MDRRTFLARTTVLAAVGIAGCTSSGTGDGDGDDNDGDRGNESDGTDNGDSTDETTSGGESTENDTTITDRTFERTGECDGSGTATVTREDGALVVEGCVRGRNGCSVAVLDTAGYDADTDQLSVVVSTEVDREGDEVCTQALVSLGYELRVTFHGPVPGSVSVVHDGPDGRTTVTSSNATE